MRVEGSIDRKLADYAHAAAQSLHVPFVSIALSDRDGTSFVDADWAAEHPELDAAGLNGPTSSAAQNLPFFAAVPIRSDAGSALGYISCGDTCDRSLSDDELGLLKSLASNVAAAIATPSPATVSAS